MIITNLNAVLSAYVKEQSTNMHLVHTGPLWRYLGFSFYQDRYDYFAGEHGDVLFGIGGRSYDGTLCVCLDGGVDILEKHAE